MSQDQWNAKLYDNAHRFVHEMAGGVIDLLAAQPVERILDLGCGTGPLTQKIASTGAAVLGVDASPAMVSAARANYPGLKFEVMDAKALPFDREFDAIFSNAVLHWVKPPEAAAERMFTALRPGGRLVMEMGGKGCVATILNAAATAGDALGLDLRPVVHINYFPSIAQYAKVLEDAGFEVGFATLFDRSTPLSEGLVGLRNWLRMFRPGIGQIVSLEKQENFYQSVEQLCKPTLLIEGVWKADYRRLRVVAYRR